jgi:hypothetical protein
VLARAGARNPPTLVATPDGNMSPAVRFSRNHACLPRIAQRSYGIGVPPPNTRHQEPSERPRSVRSGCTPSRATVHYPPTLPLPYVADVRRTIWCWRVGVKRTASVSPCVPDFMARSAHAGVQLWEGLLIKSATPDAPARALESVATVVGGHRRDLRRLYSRERYTATLPSLRRTARMVTVRGTIRG